MAVVVVAHRTGPESGDQEDEVDSLLEVDEEGLVDLVEEHLAHRQ